MSVTLEVRLSGGIVGRCDARCHNAEGGPCRCCCGGVNHGKGVAGLSADGSAAAKAAKKWARSRFGSRARRVVVERRAVQVGLFSMEVSEP